MVASSMLLEFSLVVRRPLDKSALEGDSSAIAVLLYPPAKVLKILRSVGKSRRSSLICKDRGNKEMSPE